MNGTLSRKLCDSTKRSTSARCTSEHWRLTVASNNANKAKIRIKLKVYREQLYYMAEALELIDDKLHGDSANEYVSDAINNIDKARNMLSLAVEELETKK